MSDGHIPAFKPTVGIGGGIQRQKNPWGFRLQQDPKTGLCFSGLIHIDKGAKAEFSITDGTTRSWFIVNGRCAVRVSDKSEQGEGTELLSGVGYEAHPGSGYELAAFTDCDIIEMITN